jgi:hypothetical protein
MIEQLERKACDWCGKEFYVGRVDHRFCSIPCNNKFHTEERRQALAYFRKHRDSRDNDQVAKAAVG